MRSIDNLKVSQARTNVNATQRNSLVLQVQLPCLCPQDAKVGGPVRRIGRFQIPPCRDTSSNHIMLCFIEVMIPTLLKCVPDEMLSLKMQEAWGCRTCRCFSTARSVPENKGLPEVCKLADFRSIHLKVNRPFSASSQLNRQHSRRP